MKSSFIIVAHWSQQMARTEFRATYDQVIGVAFRATYVQVIGGTSCQV